MKIIFSTNRVKAQCTDYKAAKKLFGGNMSMVTSLMARINAIERAIKIKDIINVPSFHFHKLKGRYDEYFAIDVKSRKDKWRIILRPLDNEGNVFAPCNIDEIADTVEIIEIKEVSAHYE